MSNLYRCYQCDQETKWLAPDNRCGDCTRFTPEEIRGEEPVPSVVPPKFLIIGHGRHGKDTVAELMSKYWGLRFQSSSMAACEIFIYNQLRTWGHDYQSLEECFEDRVNNRELWKDLITRYNTPDKSRLCREILHRNGNDAYVGMRCQQEYEASKPLFSKIFWVDACERMPPDPTMGIAKSPEMYNIDNNGNLYDLQVLIRSCSIGQLLEGIK